MLYDDRIADQATKLLSAIDHLLVHRQEAQRVGRMQESAKQSEQRQGVIVWDEIRALQRELLEATRIRADIIDISTSANSAVLSGAQGRG